MPLFAFATGVLLVELSVLTSFLANDVCRPILLHMGLLPQGQVQVLRLGPALTWRFMGSYKWVL